MAILTPAEQAILLDANRRQVIATAFPGLEAHRLPPRRQPPVVIDCHSYREIMLVLSGAAECMLEYHDYVGGP